MMEENRSQSHNGLTALIYFTVTAAIAAIMLVATLTAWLAELIGSVTWAMLAVGGGFLFVAWLIYMLAARRTIDYLSDRLDTIYDVAYSVRNGYNIASTILRSLLDYITRR